LNYFRLYLHSGKVTLAAIFLRRTRGVGRSFTAALTHLSTIVSPPSPAALYSERAYGGSAGGWRVAACLGRWVRSATPPKINEHTFVKSARFIISAATRNI
jgi:hypothetical protein